MGLLSNIKKVQAKGSDNDVLGGDRLFNTGLVDFKIEAAFMTESSGGATMFNLHLLDPITKKVFKTQECIVTKAGNSTYKDKEGDDVFLPGYITINSICQLSIDTELHDFGEDDTEIKTIKLYNFTDKKEVPTQVEMVTEMVGADITIGVIRQIVDKTKNMAGQGEPADYQPTGETREENVIGKVFHMETGFTIQELEAGANEGDTPEFRVKWAEKNTETYNRAKGANANNGKSGAPTTASGDAPVKKKLFGNKSKGDSNE